MIIKNFEVLMQKLDNLADINIVADAMTKICLRIERAAKEKCPVDDGALRASITHLIETHAKTVTGTVGTPTEYGPYVELGTGLFAAEGNGRKTPWTYCDAKGEWHTTAGEKPQPFLAPALNENRNIIDNDIGEALKKHIKNIT